MRSPLTALTLVGGLLLAWVPRVEALPAGSAMAGEALALCRQAERTDGDGRLALLAHGRALAEAAVAADAGDARAQFALFCNRGRQVQLAGVSLLRPFEVFGALRALDAAVGLAPDDPDVLTAKGALLVSLPRLLGGDADGGEHCLRRALTLDPHHCVARWYLADLLARRGAGDEARAIRETC